MSPDEDLKTRVTTWSDPASRKPGDVSQPRDLSSTFSLAR
jgi:hypothetical protein